jgi:putative nucleotidyltransferase with HDIG domain
MPRQRRRRNPVPKADACLVATAAGQVAVLPAPEAPTRGEELLADGRRHEREGRSPEALIAYGEAAEAGQPRVRAEALRRKGAVHRRRHEWNTALDLLRAAYAAAQAARDPIEAAETLNAMGAVHLERGELVQARAALTQALTAGMDHDELRGRIEQNFGIIANIEGDLREAVSRYSTSLVAFQQAGDERGCAIAYHNLGMVSADEQRWDQADGYYAKCLDFAERTGDVHLRGCALLNRTEVHIARQHYEDARQSAESALRIFDGLGSQQGKSDAYKFLGVLYRETGVLGLAEARLKAAIDLAAGCGATLQEAEASRELALVYRRIEQNHDSVVFLNRSIRLFQRLGAQRDLRDVSARVANLESLFVEVVANWGRSLESADTYTFGHSGRVAEYAIAVARALGLDDDGVMTVRMGAYLHDLGKMRVPHEILNKPTRLTAEEFAIIKMHTLWGLELVSTIDFPWTVKPIIRSHHEKRDGSGYPDKLKGDEVPLHAQIVCVADVYDAMTSARSYQAPKTPEAGIEEMKRCMQGDLRWWRDDVFEAFLASAPQFAAVSAVL